MPPRREQTAPPDPHNSLPLDGCYAHSYALLRERGKSPCAGSQPKRLFAIHAVARHLHPHLGLWSHPLQNHCRRMEHLQHDKSSKMDFHERYPFGKVRLHVPHRLVRAVRHGILPQPTTVGTARTGGHPQPGGHGVHKRGTVLGHGPARNVFQPVHDHPQARRVPARL